MELPISSGQFSLAGLEAVDSMAAIHPSQGWKLVNWSRCQDLGWAGSGFLCRISGGIIRYA